MAAPGESYRPAFPPKQKPHISYGIPFPQACAHHIANTFHASKVYIIVSNSVSKTDNFKRLQDALGNRVVGVRYGIKPHTPWGDVLEIVEDIRQKNGDLIVTLGAGSLTDGAKLISWALANDVHSQDDLEKLDPAAHTQGLKPCQIPIINIPTSLSGGEYSSGAGATDLRDHHKVHFSDPSMGAELVILDPALSVSTPARIWLSTGMRAIDHCVEELCSLDERATEDTDGYAVKGLTMLTSNLLETKRDWEAEAPRLAEMMGVVEAGRVLSAHVPMGASHGIGHQLGPLGVGHGETSCIMLPTVLKYNYKHGDERVRRRQEKVSDVLWGEETVAKILTERGLEKGKADAGDVLDAIVRELGLPRTLIEVGVRRDQLDALAANCLKDRWLPTNPVPLAKKEQVLEILEMTVGDEKDV